MNAVKKGVISYSVNEKASLTSDGKSFEIARREGVSKHEGLEEAELAAISNGKLVPLQCVPVDFIKPKTVLVKQIVVNQPDGSKRYINVYKRELVFFTYLQC